jgi:pyroglutamyl-peptidase
MTVLVLGFGAFEGIAQNPAAKLARAVDGCVLPVGGTSGSPATTLRVVGREMRVSYRWAISATNRAIASFDPDFVLGVGVAAKRRRASVERFAVNAVAAGRPDVDGECPVRLPGSPERLRCDSAPRLATALGARLSRDGGRYLCNAWLHHALQLKRPAAFLHVPLAGFDAVRLVQGLAAFLGAGGLR